MFDKADLIINSICESGEGRSLSCLFLINKMSKFQYNGDIIVLLTLWIEIYGFAPAKSSVMSICVLKIEPDTHKPFTNEH